MRRVLLWMFLLKDENDRWERAMKVAAQLIFFLLPFLATAALWRYSNGLAACVGMIGFGFVAFFGFTWYRWNVLEPHRAPEEVEAWKLMRRARRSARTERWRRYILWLAEHDQGKQGDLARSICADWDRIEAIADQKEDGMDGKTRLKKVLEGMPLDTALRGSVEQGIAGMTDEESAEAADDLETALAELPAVTEALEIEIANADREGRRTPFVKGDCVSKKEPTQPSPQFLVVVESLKPHVRAEVMSYDPPWTEAEWDANGDLAAGKVAIAWLQTLAFIADYRKRSISADNLDEELLPNDYFDLDYLVVKFSESSVDEDALRAVLRRYKAAIPGGAILPLSLVACLHVLGVQCV